MHFIDTASPRVGRLLLLDALPWPWRAKDQTWHWLSQCEMVWCGGMVNPYLYFSISIFTSAVDTRLTRSSRLQPSILHVPSLRRIRPLVLAPAQPPSSAFSRTLIVPQTPCIASPFSQDLFDNTIPNTMAPSYTSIAASLMARGIEDTLTTDIGDLKSTFSSWDSCMSKAYCK